MKTHQRAGAARSLYAVALAAILVLAVLPLTACMEWSGVSPSDELESDLGKIADQKRKAAQKKAAQATPGNGSGGTVMQYEAGETDPLLGGWSFSGMNHVPAAAKLYPDTEVHTVTIVKDGEKYSLGPDTIETITFDGKNVTIESNPEGGVQSKYSGVLEGDTIVGTRHHAAGSAVYDGPWNATRVK